MSGDRGNELADIRAKLERWANDPIDGFETDTGALAEDVLALLSRLDTLEADLASAQCHGDDMTILSIKRTNQLAAAEAQVEALTEALQAIERIDDGFWGEGVATPISKVVEMARLAHEALSRVSRSEPAPPNDDQGANSTENVEVRSRWQDELWQERYETFTDAGLTHDEAVEYAYRESPLSVARPPAPPVPEEQQ